MLIVGLSARMAGQAGEDLETGWILMAGTAGISGVPATHDGEPTVIEAALAPGGIGEAMAGLTGGGEASCHVVGIACGVVFLSMAAVAIAWRALIDAIAMTGLARLRGVHTGQREGGVIELALIP